jgi:hypothetical protein
MCTWKLGNLDRSCLVWTYPKHSRPGRIKLRRVPGQNQKTQFTRYSSILIDDFPEWRVIVHPKPLGVIVGIFCCDGPAQKLELKTEIFLGARVHFTFEIKLLITVTCQGKERMTAMLLRSQ